MYTFKYVLNMWGFPLTYIAPNPVACLCVAVVWIQAHAPLLHLLLFTPKAG